LTFAGTTIDHEGVKGMVRYKGIVDVEPKGGSVSSTDTSIVVKNANEVTIYISIATNFNNYHDISANENERAMSYLNKAYVKSFADILKTHTAYQKYFNRVKLDLEQQMQLNFQQMKIKELSQPATPNLPLYFQYGRYLLISSSQPGGQPANCKAWNDKIGPWDSKYTININAEMNYWPAEKTNLAALHEPFIQMVKEMAVTGQQTAKDMYGARGWVAHHNTDIWRATGAIDGANGGLFSASGGWMSQHLWEHYLYNGDKKYLGTVYDVLKGAAEFYLDFLIEEPSHKWLVVSP
jgi:alpha-L-fucosidase 2